MDVFNRLFPNMTLQKFARWAAIIGALILLVPLVIFLVEGELNSIGFITLVIGVLGLGLWLLVAPDELRAWLSGRQVYYGTGTVVLIVIVLGASVVGYSFIERQNIVRDLTENQLFTISQISIDTTEDFEQFLISNNFTAQIIGFYTRDELRERNSTRVLLSQFEEQSNGLIEVEFIDPDVNPILAGQFDFSEVISDDIQSRRLFLAVLDQNDEYVTFENITATDERQISNAMLRIMLAGNFKLYFVTGHLGYNPIGESDFGLSTVFFTLLDVGINVDLLELSTIEVIPEDATAIVIAGPQTPFRQDEVDKIADYIQRGGRMLILADPPYVDDYETVVTTNTFMLQDNPFSQYLWDEFGVRFREDLISDNGSSFENEFNVVAQQIIQNQEIMIGFPQTAILFPLVRSIEIVDPVDVESPNLTERQAQYSREPMLLTSNDAFGETQLTDIDVDNPADFNPDEDTQGPLLLAVAVRGFGENPNTTPRIVLVGDAEWLTNQYINPLDGQAGIDGNILLWNNILEWLTQFTERVEIPPVNSFIIPLTVTDQQQNRIQLVTLIVLPGIVLGVGVFVWISRRRNSAKVLN